MKQLLKACARLLLGDYAPYFIYRVALDGRHAADTGKFRIDLVDRAAIEACPDPLMREQAFYAGPGALAFACRDGERIVGLCFYWEGERYRQRNFWPLQPDEAKLVQIVTLDAMRGQGVAFHLIRASCQHLAQSGYKRAYARIWHSNTPSLRAFERAGWSRIALVLELFPFRRRRAWRLVRSLAGKADSGSNPAGLT